MEKVIAQFNIPGVTPKQYDHTWADLRAAGHAEPKELLHYLGDMVVGVGITGSFCEIW